MTHPMTHRGWRIEADYSCPCAAMTWSAFSPDYDPEEPPYGSYAYAPTYAELLDAIEDAIEEDAA